METPDAMEAGQIMVGTTPKPIQLRRQVSTLTPQKTALANTQ